MASATAPLCLSLFLLAVLAPALGYTWSSSYESYDHDYYHPRSYQRQAEPRSLFARARSIMPRFADVAAETATALAIPALVVLAFSALWPEHHYYRVKRDSGEATTPTEELTEHMMNVYFAAMESDECLQRVVCELGASAKTLKPQNQNIIVSMLGSVSSKKYASLFEKFKSGMNSERCQKIGCGFLDN
ncbi:uncharacterized protein LOC125040876 [Penaeus chinensis]|uniref:uncharacterized protein LOC125040876 n=1 Tax=Penaeus chinensis TaxID=139456 RepID=UPI001FB7B826|nr:uncharacterized protein LOC125040876 [Penaeus chinensis]